RQRLETGELREMRQALVAERRVAQADRAELAKSGERLQTGTFDERVTEIEGSKAGQRRERLEGGVVEQRVTEIEAPERPDGRQMRGAKIAHLRAAQTELLELRQVFQQRDLAVRDRRRLERDGDGMAVALPHVAADRAQPAGDRLLAAAFDCREIRSARGRPV